MAVSLVTGFTQRASKPGLLITITSGDAVISGAVVRFATGDISLAANTLTYIYLNFTSGFIESSTVGFLAGAWPICTAQTDNIRVTTISDMRPDAFSGGGGTAVNTKAKVTHLFLDSFTAATGLFTASQPALADLSDTPAQNLVVASPNGSGGALTARALVVADVPTLNQNTTGSAASLSAVSALPNGTTATTQAALSNDTKVATDAYADAAVLVEKNRATAAEALLVPQTTTVNGHALSSNVVVSASDITTGTLPHAQLPALVLADIPTGYTWDQLGSALGALTLSNAGNGTTFNHTSAVAWLWANTTIASAITTNASPLLEVAANYWTGAASAADTWTISSGIGAGTNATSTLTIGHSGSTGIPKVVIQAVSSSTLTIGNAVFYTGAALGIANANFAGLHNTSSSPVTLTSPQGCFLGIGTAVTGWLVTATGQLAASVNLVLGWGTQTVNSGTAALDTGLSRSGAAGIAIGNGTAADVSGAITLATITQQSANGAQWVKGQSSELLTLSTVGLTTDTTGNLLPAGSIIEAVVCRVTTTITTTTNWAVGDATQSARFSSANATLVAGTTSIGLNQADPTVASSNLGPVQVAAAKVRITCTGSNPGAGVVRITVFYRQFVAPTS